MSRLFKLQFLGPFTLFAATLCAELAARALQYAPGSELLWFINLRMFGIFQRSYGMLLNLSEVVPIDGFQYFGLALPIFVFVLACVGLAAKSRLPLTVATHLSAAYAGFFGPLLAGWRTHRYAGIAWTHCGPVGCRPVRDGDHFRDLPPVLCDHAPALSPRRARGNWCSGKSAATYLWAIARDRKAGGTLANS